MEQHELWKLAEQKDGGLYAAAAALMSVAYQIKYLGNGDAATPMGALEAFGAHMGEKIDRLADAIKGL